MRSEHISRALAAASSRFEVCNRISRGAREMHVPGDMMANSINVVAAMADPAAPRVLARQDEIAETLHGATDSGQR